MFVSKVYKILFSKFKNNREDKDEGRLFLISKMKKVQFQKNISENLFSSSKPKVIFIFSYISQNFINFGYKHVETGTNCLHEL